MNATTTKEELSIHSHHSKTCLHRSLSWDIMLRYMWLLRLCKGTKSNRRRSRGSKQPAPSGWSCCTPKAKTSSSRCWCGSAKSRRSGSAESRRSGSTKNRWSGSTKRRRSGSTKRRWSGGTKCGWSGSWSPKGKCRWSRNPSDSVHRIVSPSNTT